MRIRTAERRTALLKAALSLVSERGYAETRVEDVARRAGVAKGTVYLYFRDKPAIFVGLIAWLFAQALAVTEQVATMPVSAREKLDALFSAWAKGVTSSPQVVSLLSMEEVHGSSTFMKRLRKQVLPHLRRVQDAIASIVRQGIIQGEFRTVDPRAAAMMFLAAFRAELLAGGGPTGVRRSAESAKELFLHGILANRRRVKETVCPARTSDERLVQSTPRSKDV